MVALVPGFNAEHVVKVVKIEPLWAVGADGMIAAAIELPAVRREAKQRVQGDLPVEDREITTQHLRRHRALRCWACHTMPGDKSDCAMDVAPDDAHRWLCLA